VQVIDTLTQQVQRTLEPGRAVLHMEFTPRGEAVWISSRDNDRVSVIDTRSFATLAELKVDAPSGIFFTSRAARIGF
jgi:protein NirF